MAQLVQAGNLDVDFNGASGSSEQTIQVQFPQPFSQVYSPNVYVALQRIEMTGQGGIAEVQAWAVSSTGFNFHFGVVPNGGTAGKQSGLWIAIGESV
jgi:H-type lectin domain